MCAISTSLTGCPHTQNSRGSVRVACSAQDTLCAKGQPAVIQPFLLPGTQQQRSQTHTHWEGEHDQALLSAEHVQGAGKQAETIKKEKILYHALTVHVQMAGWSLVCLEKQINTGLTVTNTENKQWGRFIQQLGLSQAPASRLCITI